MKKKNSEFKQKGVGLAMPLFKNILTFETALSSLIWCVNAG